MLQQSGNRDGHRATRPQNWDRQPRAGKGPAEQSAIEVLGLLEIRRYQISPDHFAGVDLGAGRLQQRRQFDAGRRRPEGDAGGQQRQHVQGSQNIFIHFLRSYRGLDGPPRA